LCKWLCYRTEAQGVSQGETPRNILRPSLAGLVNESHPAVEFSFHQNDRFPAWKVVFFQCLVAVVFFVLVVGYWKIQIGEHGRYAEQAERNRIRSLPIIAPRGRVLDRQGRVLVDNAPAFGVLLLRENGGLLTADKVAAIARGLNLDPLELQTHISDTARVNRFQPIIIKPHAELEDASFVESHLTEFPELALLEVQERVYPHQSLAAATLGHVGEVSEEQVDKPGSLYRPGDVVGQSGVEREYNSVLSGGDGMRRAIVNSRGEEVGSMTSIEAEPGRDLRLTLDLDIQQVAETALGDRDGAVVALDPRTGDVLAMVSHPTFDPNGFARHINRQAWERLTADPGKPLMNKAIQAQLAPGSVFKIFTATAALETGTITPDFTVFCPGEVTIYGHTFHDWTFENGHGHGRVDLHEAIVHSCDVYFYTLGKLLGIDRIAYFAKHLGLGARTGIDLPAEEGGLIPSPEWVEKVYHHPWYPGETIPVAIGQGAVVVTPLQLAYALGGVASGGVFHTPHLVSPNSDLSVKANLTAGEAKHFSIEPGTLECLRRGMWGVVNEGGTGAGAKLPGIDMAGKTGTAQVVSAKLQKSSRSSTFNNNAWFVGFSPSSKPEIIVAVLVMGGGHSAVAAPMARDVIKAYYDKKQSHQPTLEQAETQVRLLSGPLQVTSGGGKP
jgi:penicillin-binding protein 2